MGSLLESLRKLQSIEEKLVYVRKKLRTRQRAADSQTQKIDQLKHDCNVLKEQKLTKRKRADEFELDLKDHDAHVTKLRGSLNTARTNKEYAAILTQINTLKADNARSEEEGLKIFQEIEDLDARIIQSEEKIAHEEAKLQEIVEKNSDELSKLNSMLEKLQEQRNQATEGMDASILNRFDRLAEKFDGEAMASVEIHGKRAPYTYICGGCFMSLNSEHANVLQTHDEIRCCNNCGRILYLDSAAANLNE